MTGHQARKRFGQHFLTSDEVIQQIVHAVSPQQGETIVEIGPGQGAITTPLAQLATTLHAIEFDRDLVPQLIRRYADNKNVRIHEADALNFDFANLGNKLRIVGNLPYNISTPLLFQLLRYRDCITDMHFMLQKEVVDRMAAQPGNKTYGRLTIMLGCALEVVPLFDVPREAFSPPPKIMSSIVRMRPIPQPAFKIHDAAVFESLVRLAFSRRRKTLRNALQGMATVADIEALGLDPTARPEQVGIEDWIALANEISVGAS
jgi:16S rRNA (adenine1518-N6/adenine1519-N6)-dimethyltransferase